MNETTGIIRFELDGSWSVAELGKSLAHLDDLYNLRLMLQVIHEDWHDWEKMYFEFMHFPPFRRILKRGILHPSMIPLTGLYAGVPGIPLEPRNLSRISNLIYPDEQLQVRQIKYSSPGFVDLAGIGAIVGHIKDFILAIIPSVRKKRQLENKKLEEEIQGIRIENALKFVQLAKDLGYTGSELRELINWVDERQETFIQLADKRKIREVSLMSDNFETKAMG